MYHSIKASPTIEEVLATSPDLPALPVVATQVIRLTLDSDAGAQEIAQLLGQDPSLAARVLKLANSAFYGLNRQVGSLKDAVVILGMRTVREIATVAGALPWLKKPVTGYALEPGALLSHSTGLAVGAQNVARIARLKGSDQVYVSGLLSDIGKLVLSRSLDGRMGEMLKLGLEAGMSFDEVERQVVGFDHCQVAEHLTRSWSLPESTVQAVRWHHDPGQCPEEFRQMADCIHLADYLSMVCGFGLGGDGLSYKFDESSLMRLGISPDTIDSVIDEFVVSFEAQEQVIKELIQS